MPGDTQVALKGSSPSTLPGNRLVYQSLDRKSGRKILPRAALPSSSAVALARSPARTQPVPRLQSVQSNPGSLPAHFPLPNYPPPTYEESLRALPRTRQRAPLLSNAFGNTTPCSLERSSSSVKSHCSDHGSNSNDTMGLWLTLRTSSVGSRLAGYHHHHQTNPPPSPWLSQSDYYQSLATYYRTLEDNTNHNCRNDSTDKPYDNHCDEPWSVSSSLATIEPTPSFRGQFNEHSSHHKKKRSLWKTFLNDLRHKRPSMSRRLRRGCSLEVIFEEEDCTPFSHLAQPAEDHCFSSPDNRPRRVRNKISPGFIAVYKRRRSRSLSALLDSSVEVLTEDPNWDTANSEEEGDTEWDHRRAPLSRRQIIERSSFEDLAALLDPQPPQLDLNAPELPLSPPAVVKSPQPCSSDSHFECNIRADFLIHCTCGSGRVVFKMVLNSTMPLKHMQAIPESEALPEIAGGAGGGPAKRRTSIYEALAMANQVSQGSMTRRYRQFFEEQSQRGKENKGALDVHPGPILNQTIVTAAPVHTIKEHELNPMAAPPTEPKKISKPSWTAAKEVHIDQKKTPKDAGESKVKDFPSSSIGHHSGLRCEVCSAPIQANRAKPEAALPQKEVDVVVPSVEEFDPPSTELACKPTNKEVVEDELPKPNTVKNVRNLFETESDAILPHPYGTFRPASVNSGRFSMGYVKSNPSSKILRSESLSSLNHLPHYHLSRSSSTMSLHSSQPHAVLLTLPKEDIEPLEEKGYVVALGRLAPLRSLSRQERDAVFRSPSPPPYRSGAGAHSHRSLRTSHSIPPEFTPRPYVDSIYSEASEWSSDWDNHSDTASSTSVSSPRPGSTSNHSSDGVRYIAPDVLERIRSYGLTFQFVDGKMVSSDNDDPESAPVSTSMRQKSEAPAPKPKVTAVKSAAPQFPAKKKGSALTSTPKSTKNTLGKTVSAPLPMTTAHALEKVSSTQPRVISYVPKTSTPYPVVTTTTTAERVRHCSGDSSASSSGVSSVAQRSDSASSESESVGGSPFCSLKRVKKRDLTSNDNAFFERDGRPCSPGPVECPSVKSVAESIYGMYSVMYNFRHSQVTPHIKV